MRIGGTTKKRVLRDAMRDIITDTVNRRQKHKFLSPPLTLNPDKRFRDYSHDTLRGPDLAAILQSASIDYCRAALPHP